MNNPLNLRMAAPGDAEALLNIYRPYITASSASFETEVPDLAAFRARICHTLETYPYLVAEVAGQPVGYAYGAALRGRPAYDWAVETTIYLSQNACGQGIGRALYHELLGLLTTQNFTRAYACITGSNTGSIAFHEAFGYTMAGRFSGCGYKHGRWEDVCWLERPLAAAQNPPLPIVPLSHMA